ncbi:hypothetical protein T439DRAFT_322718 [Meredithblackwellia eburnea MCA 4105]
MELRIELNTSTSIEVVRTQPHSALLQLPSELLILICSCLPIDSVIAVANSSRTLKRICNTEQKAWACLEDAAATAGIHVFRSMGQQVDHVGRENDSNIPESLMGGIEVLHGMTTLDEFIESNEGHRRRVFNLLVTLGTSSYGPP